MARIVHCHPSQSEYDYHSYTDLDFWDARRILTGLAVVKRNFGQQPPGDEFPTQVVGSGLNRAVRATIEKRLRKAVSSPPRHVMVRSILMDGFYEFDPSLFYPSRWSRSRMLRVTYLRTPMEQSGLSSPYKTARVQWVGDKIRIDSVPRGEKYDPPIRNKRESLRRLNVPSCF